MGAAMMKARLLNVLVASGAVSATMMLTSLAFADACTDACKKQRNSCMAKVGKPGAQTAQQCANEYKACLKECQKKVTEKPAQCTKVGSEYGTYCSGTWPDGGWAFNSDPGGGDPC